VHSGSGGAECAKQWADAMWREVIRCSMALELLLVAVEHSFEVDWLPLGGGPLEQIAIVFIACLCLLEAMEVWHAMRQERR
jgi:hypothetical protein